MSGAAVMAMFATAISAAVVIGYVNEYYGEIVLMRAIRRIRARALRLRIIAVCLLFYFRQYNAAIWNGLHLIGMDKRAAAFFNQLNGIDRVNIESDTLYAIYCAEHLQKADNDSFTAEYIRCARAGYNCIDILFDGIPEDQRPEPAMIDQAIWILRYYGKED